MNIREEFKNHVSKSSFVNIDGVTRIVGKYGEIEIIDDLFDIWFVGPERASLSGKRIKSVENKLRYLVDLRILNGEAYCQTKNKEIAIKCLPLLGVRKKRQISDKERERLAEMGIKKTL